MASPEDLAELEEDEFPVVSLSRQSFGGPSALPRDSFELKMPDARDLAAQRKLEDDMEAELRKYELPEILPMEDTIIPDIKLLHTPKIKVTKTVENPGIVLEKLNKMDVIDKFDGSRAMFLSDMLESARDLKETLSWFSDSIESCIVHDKAGFTSADVHCLVLACSLVLLDKRNRGSVSPLRIRTYMAELLNVVLSLQDQSDAFLIDLAEHLLKVVTDCHNRVMLAQAFECHLIEPQNIRDPANFANRLAVTVAHISLKEVLGVVDEKVVTESLSMAHLRDAVFGGARWKDLNAQEQYSALMLMNMLKGYAQSEESTDLAAVDDVLKFLAKMKFRDFQVNMLITKMSLFWQVRDKKERNGKRKDKMEICDVMD